MIWLLIAVLLVELGLALAIILFVRWAFNRLRTIYEDALASLLWYEDERLRVTSIVEDIGRRFAVLIPPPVRRARNGHYPPS